MAYIALLTLSSQRAFFLTSDSFFFYLGKLSLRSRAIDGVETIHAYTHTCGLLANKNLYREREVIEKPE